MKPNRNYPEDCAYPSVICQEVDSVGCSANAYLISGHFHVRWIPNIQEAMSFEITNFRMSVFDAVSTDSIFAAEPTRVGRYGCGKYLALSVSIVFVHVQTLLSFAGFKEPSHA